MKKSLLTLILMVAMLPLMASTYEQLADGVYQDGTTLYIGSNVTSLGDLQVNPSEIFCYATVPPACLSNTFTGYNATLHVPTTAMVNYFSTQYWYYFTNVMADAIEPSSLTLSHEIATIEVGEQFHISANVTPANATPNTVSWYSTNPAVATVTDGIITTVSPGECNIIANCATLQAICHVAVTSARVTITLDKHVARVLPNHMLTLTATCSPMQTDLTVMSSDNTIAMPRLVNGSIQVLGIKEGTATITVGSVDGTANTDACIVTVYTEIGDLNCDGFVNITDVTILISIIISNDGISANPPNADCNRDGTVNITDVTTLISFLLGGHWPWEQETFIVNGVSFTMVAIEGGSFTMGATPEQGNDTYSNEFPAHQVTLSSFSIGQTEVTQALWLAVMGTNPSYYTGDLNRPVEQVRWNDCQTFIAKLNELTGKTFRLPTEAEWEFAARGGKKSKGYKYSGSNEIDEVAWYRENAYEVGIDNPDYGPHTVSSKAPNELGLYDMSGNVSEWCQDWYGPYNSEAQIDPTGPVSGSYHVCRGGSWNIVARQCRVSRHGYFTNTISSSKGMRLAL